MLAGYSKKKLEAEIFVQNLSSCDVRILLSFFYVKKEG